MTPLEAKRSKLAEARAAAAAARGQKPRVGQGKKGPKRIPRPSTVLFAHQRPNVGTVEHHAVNHGVVLAHFLAAKAVHHWPLNAEVSEEAFLAAIEAVKNAKVR